MFMVWWQVLPSMLLYRMAISLLELAFNRHFVLCNWKFSFACVLPPSICLNVSSLLKLHLQTYLVVHWFQNLPANAEDYRFDPNSEENSTAAG